MAVRSCKVTYLDSGGVEHAVQVSAQTLYEAIGQALRGYSAISLGANTI
jgi:hypothetical protein